MKQYDVSILLESLIAFMSQNKNVQKLDLVNHLREKGSFERRFDLCSKFVEWLKIKKFIKVVNPFYGYLKLTDKALEWEKNKKAIQMNEKALKNIQENYQLLMELKLIRKMIADEKKIDLYKVCPNYMLEKLAYYQPENIDAVFKINGFKEWQGDTQWHRYIEVIQEWKAQNNNNYKISA
ncbi:MAG: hypothetical protein KatS3mg035_0067 [Bacteroidia bacterium]|nr:MAG: hypothetical protein KatS3mg035_0067 [Bacteroidia bacterium]